MPSLAVAAAQSCNLIDLLGDSSIRVGQPYAPWLSSASPTMGRDLAHIHQYIRQTKGLQQSAIPIGNHAPRDADQGKRRQPGLRQTNCIRADADVTPNRQCAATVPPRTPLPRWRPRAKATVSWGSNATPEASWRVKQDALQCEPESLQHPGLVQSADQRVRSVESEDILSSAQFRLDGDINLCRLCQVVFDRQGLRTSKPRKKGNYIFS